MQGVHASNQVDFINMVLFFKVFYLKYKIKDSY